MNTVQEIESAVAKLPPKDLKEFRAWFYEYEADQWDSQFECDVKAGKLNKIAEKVLNDFVNGKCSKL